MLTINIKEDDAVEILNLVMSGLSNVQHSHTFAKDDAERAFYQSRIDKYRRCARRLRKAIAGRG